LEVWYNEKNMKRVNRMFKGLFKTQRIMKNIDKNINQSAYENAKKMKAQYQKELTTEIDPERRESLRRCIVEAELRMKHTK